LAPRASDALLGCALGSYRVARLIGQGGMGKVYLGVQPDIGAKVAIKVLLDTEGDSRRIARFFSEARAVNVVRHEHIVDVLDLGTLPDGAPYIIMELVEGETLAALVEERSPLPLGSVARLVAEVLAALDATHQKGIFHRDLKPENVMVTPAGHPKILDFGIAKLEGDGQKLTGTGAFVGTPLYAAPEQARGLEADGRADLYAVGAILFEAVTGRAVFVSDSLYGLLEKHASEPPPSARALRPDLPAAYEAVILRALAKAPNERYATARDMAEALTAAATGLPEAAFAPLHGVRPASREARVAGFSRTGLDVAPPPAQEGTVTPAGLVAPTLAAPPARSGLPRRFVPAVLAVLGAGLCVGYMVRVGLLATPAANVDPPPAAASVVPAAASVAAPVVSSAAPCPDTRCAPLEAHDPRAEPVALLGEVTTAARTLEPTAVFAGLFLLETPDGRIDVGVGAEGGGTATYLFRVPGASPGHEVVVGTPRGGVIGVSYQRPGDAVGLAARAATTAPACTAPRALAAAVVAGLRDSDKKTMAYHRGALGGPDGWSVTDGDAAERWIDGKTCVHVPPKPAPRAPAARPSPQEIRRLQAEAIRDRRPIPHWP